MALEAPASFSSLRRLASIRRPRWAPTGRTGALAVDVHLRLPSPSLPSLVVLTVLLLGLVLVACGDNEPEEPGPAATDTALAATETASPSTTPGAAGGQTPPIATDDDGGDDGDGGQASPTATLSPEQIATVEEFLRNVPVLSEESTSGWSEEGEAPAEKLTEVCPPSTARTPFADRTSPVLGGPNGETAVSAGVVFAEQSDTQPYAQELFADAAGCAQRLVAAWLDRSIAFRAGGPVDVGEASVLVVNVSGADPAAAIFFRHEEAVAAVVVVGAGADASVGPLARAVADELAGWFEELTSPERR